MKFQNRLSKAKGLSRLIQRHQPNTSSPNSFFSGVFTNDEIFVFTGGTPTYIPPNLTEAEVLEAIERCVSMLAKSFAFGFYTEEDISQEVRAFCIEALPRYDGVRELAPFLFRHSKNRLCNVKRKAYRRAEIPCHSCHKGEFCKDNAPCKKYQGWLTRNASKAALFRPKPIEKIADDYCWAFPTNEEDLSFKELIEKIDRALPVELRSTYLQMREGLSIPRSKRTLVEDAIKTILKGEVHAERE